MKRDLSMREKYLVLVFFALIKLNLDHGAKFGETEESEMSVSHANQRSVDYRANKIMGTSTTF